MKFRAILFAAIVAIAWSLWSLLATTAGVNIETTQVDEIPVTIFRPASGPPGPAVVIAHGFAGSQQLMQPAAETLARAGYTAITFDLAGHGRNARPLSGGVKDHDLSAKILGDEIDRMIRYAQTLGGPRVGLVGHSMAAILIINSAIKNDAVAGVVAFSNFGSKATASEPKNLLIVDGAWEAPRLKDDALRIIGLAAASPQERVTYGDMAKGTARRLVYAEGAEHVGVIYSRDGQVEMRDWMNAVFGRAQTGEIDARGKAIGLLFLGLFALAAPLSRLLPNLSPTPLGAGLPFRRQWVLAVAPAVLTPLILWKIPTDFLPILLGDYLVVHFALYGALTFAALWLTTRSDQILRAPWRGAVFAAIPIFLYYAIGFGLPIDAFATSVTPTATRWLLIPPMFCGVVLYFLADEWLTRGVGAAKAGFFFSKFCLVASLAVAVALNPQKLFFLVMIVPVICLVFVLFGWVSRLAYQRTGDPRIAALAHAAALAFAICATFPVVD